MTTRAQKIVFGAYTVTSTIGEVQGYAAAADDLKITELGTSETQTQPGGGTVQRTITNPGKSASGTLVLTKAAGASEYQTGYIGKIIMITNNGDGSTRPYCVESWEESAETDTGRRIATFTAVSEDSMVDAYLAGPVDPDTGTASNYVFGGVVGVAYVNTTAADYALNPAGRLSAVEIVSGTVGSLTNGAIYIDGNRFRIVVPKASNAASYDDWNFELVVKIDGGTEEHRIFNAGDEGTSLGDLDGVFDLMIAVSTVSGHA